MVSVCAGGVGGSIFWVTLASQLMKIDADELPGNQISQRVDLEGSSGPEEKFKSKGIFWLRVAPMQIKSDADDLPG